MIARWGVVLWVVLVSGCARNRPTEEEIAFRAALEAIDAAWRDRARGGLEGVERALETVSPGRVADPEVRWRQSRLDVAEGLAAPEQRSARRAFADGRDVGAACLLDDDPTRADVGREGWAAASAAIPEGRLGCAAWAGMAWVRWLGSFGGDAAAIDRLDIEAIVAAGRTSSDTGHAEIADWAEGLRQEVFATDEATRRHADELLLSAYDGGLRRDRDDLWVRWGDVVQWVDPVRRSSRTPPQRSPAAPEERAVEARLTAARPEP